MIREILKDAETVRIGLSHVPSQPALLPPFRDPGGLLSRSGGLLNRNDRPPDIWDTHGTSGNVFVNPPASSSSPHPGGFNPWIFNVTKGGSVQGGMLVFLVFFETAWAPSRNLSFDTKKNRQPVKIKL